MPGTTRSAFDASSDLRHLPQDLADGGQHDGRVAELNVMAAEGVSYEAPARGAGTGRADASVRGMTNCPR